MGRHKEKNCNRSISCSKSKSSESRSKSHTYCDPEELYKKLTDKRKELEYSCPKYYTCENY